VVVPVMPVTVGRVVGAVAVIPAMAVAAPVVVRSGRGRPG